MKLVYVFAVFVSLCWADCGPWVPLNANTLPHANPDDQIDVFYIVAPLMECGYNNDFALIDAYHGGIGIVNQNSGFSITLNYDATPSFLSALIPEIQGNNLVWSNQGAVFIYSGINVTFWYTKIELVANINGDQYNKYMSWIGDFNASYPWYDLWTAVDSFPGKILPPYPHDCFFFVWETYSYLQTLGATIIPSETQVGLLAFLSDNVPVKVDMTNPSVQKDVFNFYNDMVQDITDDGVLGMFEVMLKLVWNDNFYFHVGSDYYQIINIKFPYVETIYDYLPVYSNTTKLIKTAVLSLNFQLRRTFCPKTRK